MTAAAIAALAQAFAQGLPYAIAAINEMRTTADPTPDQWASWNAAADKAAADLDAAACGAKGE